MPSSVVPNRKVSVEFLEPRQLLSSTFTNVNISKMSGNQAEGAITVNRADPSHLFAVSNLDRGDGLLAGLSSDGGQTWTTRVIADNKDGLPPACCDPSTTYDAFGNLFLTYLNSTDDKVIVALSTDNGQSFSVLRTFAGDVDQPTIASGPGGVWTTFAKGNRIVVAGAPVAALNAVGEFSLPTAVPGPTGGNFGDIAIGPAGQVMVTYQKPTSGGGSKLFVNVDPDGLGPAKFGKPIVAATTHVSDFDFLPAQETRGIDAEVGLAYDRSGGPYNGRVYMVYTDEVPAFSGNTEIELRYSDNGGSVWSNPIRANDDTTLNSQFLPRIAMDNTTGELAVGWYDARNDQGASGPGDTNKTPNDEATYYATIVTPQVNGVIVAPNLQISAGVSDAGVANNSIDLGDYTGLDFYNGVARPLWFDNSNSTGDNPDGKLHDLDVYTASVSASSFDTSASTSLGGLADPSGPVASLPAGAGINTGFIKSGRSYTITVTYSDADGVSVDSIGSSNLLITGPDGFSESAQLVRAHARKGGAVLATYKVLNPTGDWSPADAGVYTITLEPNQILDGRSRSSTSGVLGTFAVATGLTSGSHGGGTGLRHHHGDPDEH